MQRGADRSRVEHEVGDLLFSCVNLARHAEIDAESALASATARFERRVGAVERAAQERGQPLRGMTPAELDALWVQAKAAEESSDR